MQLGDDAPWSPAACSAVVRAARSQLAGIDATHPAAADELATLLDVTDDMLVRASFDDTVGERRAAESSPLAELLGGPVTQPGLADRIGDLDPRGETIREVVAILVRTDLGAVPSVRLRMPTPADTPSTSTTAVTEYLRSRGDNREVLSATGVAGGFSKETMLVALREPSGAVEELVLRKVATGRTAGTLPDEYDVLRFVAAAGLAVPTPRWLDAEGGSLGGPLFAADRMPGSPAGTVTGPSETATPVVARQLATLIGRLHALDVAGLTGTPKPPMMDSADLLDAIDERERIVDDVTRTLPGTPGLALYRALISWLRAHVPGSDTGTVLVHGDVGFHNLLVEDGRLSALLDWEVAHLGRPAEDLAYVRPSVEPLLPWAQFVDSYREAGGRPADDAELRFFTVWQDAWRAISCLRLRTKFVRDPARLADGVSGLLLTARFLDSALRTAFGGHA